MKFLGIDTLPEEKRREIEAKLHVIFDKAPSHAPQSNNVPVTNQPRFDIGQFLTDL
jgi:hypothetical protein